MEKIKVSIVIISYKQVKYIRQAIDSVLMQKVDFKYELILADDCSQDGTLEIMREYQRKYPDIVRVLERKKNLGCAMNSLDACINSKGEYLTILEGDDYWSDKNKIQMQVDFLDDNADFVAISHLQEGRDLSNKLKGYFPVGIKKDFIITDPNDFVNNDKAFSCSATLYRNFYRDKQKLKIYIKTREFDSLIGDAQINFYLSTLGKIYVSAKPMMVYRMRSNDGDSNFNSSHPVDEIQYRYMYIYIKLEELFNSKYSLYKRIRNTYVLGVAYSLIKFKFKSIRKFNALCPKKYKLKIILLFPFICFGIMYSRLMKKKK